MYNRILTADNMIKKHWECNQTCPLCYCLPENADHLLAKCNFVEAVWNNIASQFLLPSYASMSASGSYLEWVRILLAIGSQKRKPSWVSYSCFGGKSPRRETSQFSMKMNTVTRVDGLIKE
jgi:hypothetical protein